MIKEINAILNKLPDRNVPRTDDNILNQHSFSSKKENMDTNVVDLFRNLPKDRIITQNLTNKIEDFK